MRRLATLVLVSWFVTCTQTAQAQIVRWGPDGGVSIRAPFVNVDVGPGGSTRVRAPFTAVDTPGFRSFVPRYEYRSQRVPSNRAVGPRTGRLRPLSADEFTQSTLTTSPRTVTDPAQMSWLELRRHTRAVAVRLENELRRVADGTTWTASLRPGTIRDLLAEDSEQTPDDATIDQLTAILQSYDALVDSAGYPQIARLSGFQEMRQALGEMVLPPQERSRRNVAKQWTALYRDLDQFPTGATWQEFLELTPDVRDGRADLKQTVHYLEDLVARYEQVIGPEEYQAIAQLPSFQATRQGLVDYAEALEESAGTADSKLSQPESLPLPKPLP